MTDRHERWKNVPWSMKYEVSDHGAVRKRINAQHPERRQYAPIKQLRDKDGYFYLRIDGCKWLVHRLVYRVFIGELVRGLVVCHLDGVSTNNRPTNLLQSTQRENIGHKRVHGTAQEGEKHPHAKLSNEQAKRIVERLALSRRTQQGRLARGEAAKVAADACVPVTAVYSIARSRRTYRCVDYLG